MLPSARLQIAGERNRSRWDQARLNLVVPVGAIVAVAIACVTVAVLTSAHNADEFSYGHEQDLVRHAIANRAEGALRALESSAGTPLAAAKIRDGYDAQWVDEHVGGWLESFFNDDAVLIVDGNDQVEYVSARNGADPRSIDLNAALAPVLDLLRGRLAALPDHVVPAIADQDVEKPGRSTALIQTFGGKPAIVTAVAVGTAAELARGNDRAPIAVSVKYINERMLKRIAGELQLPQLRRIDDQAPIGGDRVADLADTHGAPILRFAWHPTRPGWQIVTSVLPFLVAALAGFALLVWFVMHYMRRTTEAIASGERQLRHLALHDPVCGLPNRIYFAERLEQAIMEMRGGGLSTAVFYIDLDHFKDVNDTLGHHIGDEHILNVTQRLSRVMRGDDLVARLGGDEFALSPPAPRTPIRCRRSPDASSPGSARLIRSAAITSSSAPRSGSP